MALNDLYTTYKCKICGSPVKPITNLFNKCTKILLIILVILIFTYMCIFNIKAGPFTVKEDSTTSSFVMSNGDTNSILTSSNTLVLSDGHNTIIKYNSSDKLNTGWQVYAYFFKLGTHNYLIHYNSDYGFFKTTKTKKVHFINYENLKWYLGRTILIKKDSDQSIADDITNGSDDTRYGVLTSVDYDNAYLGGQIVPINEIKYIIYSTN